MTLPPHSCYSTNSKRPHKHHKTSGDPRPTIGSFHGLSLASDACPCQNHNGTALELQEEKRYDRRMNVFKRADPGLGFPVTGSSMSSSFGTSLQRSCHFLTPSEWLILSERQRPAMFDSQATSWRRGFVEAASWGTSDGASLWRSGWNVTAWAMDSEWI